MKSHFPNPFSKYVSLLCVLFFTGSALHAADDGEAIEFFEKRIRPVLANNCYRCHGSEKQESDLRLDSYAAMLRGGATSPAVVPESPGESLLISWR